MSPILFALIYAVLAGMMNGSFALPTKYNKHWNFENIWFGFALFGFVLIPWITILLLDPKVMHIYHLIQPYTLIFLIVGGAFFGVGQICFALCLEIIGFGLGFVINIGLGTGLGFLLPLLILHPAQVLTPAGRLTLVGIVFILIGLMLSYYAGKQRNNEINANVQSHRLSLKKNYQLGILLATIAGLFSAGQNLTFAMTSNVQQLALASGTSSLAAAIIIWPVFLLCSFVPYGGFMLYLHGKNNSLQIYTKPQSWRYIGITLLMGLLWYGSLILYSKSSLLIGKFGPVVAWPLFMVSIILTSNCWGWRHKEWAECRPAIKYKALLAILALIIAVIILAYGATLPF